MDLLQMGYTEKIKFLYCTLPKYLPGNFFNILSWPADLISGECQQ